MGLRGFFFGGGVPCENQQISQGKRLNGERKSSDIAARVAVQWLVTLGHIGSHWVTVLIGKFRRLKAGTVQAGETRVRHIMCEDNSMRMAIRTGIKNKYQ